MHDTPEQIAARLTKAQRRAILWLPKDGSAQSEWGYAAPRTDVLKRLRSNACAAVMHTSFAGCSYWALTPRGAAVRAVVAKEDGDA